MARRGLDRPRRLEPVNILFCLLETRTGLLPYALDGFDLLTTVNQRLYLTPRNDINGGISSTTSL
jgi:hypothetical protein